MSRITECLNGRVGPALLLVLYVLVYLLPLNIRPLASPDEVRYGEIPREMIVSGDWVSPHFNGVRYFEKPVLGYWLIAGSLLTFGDTRFAIRLPMALATGLAALVLFALTRRFINRRVALTSVAIFLSTWLVLGTGTFAVLDAIFSLFVTCAMACYYLGLQAEGKAAQQRKWLMLCGAACAGAFLVKGFIGLAIPVIIAAPYLIAQRRWRTLITSPWWPIAIAAVIIAPWAIAIQFHEPDYWHYFFWIQNIKRFAGNNAQHAQPFWYYLAALPLIAWPWILFLPAALVGLWRRHRGNTTFLWYAAAWAVLPFVFFSISKGKLQTYILPCLAPLSIILASGLDSYCTFKRHRLFQLASAIVAFVFILVIGALVALQSGLIGQPVFQSSETAKFITSIFLLSAGVAVSASASLGRTTQKKRCASRWYESLTFRIAAIAIAGVVTILPLEIAAAQRLLAQVAPVVTVLHYAETPPGTIVVSDDSLFGTVSWALKRTDVYTVSSGEMYYGLSYPKSRHRLLDNQQLSSLIAKRDTHAMLIICKQDSAEKIGSAIPETATRKTYPGIVVWRLPPAIKSGDNANMTAIQP